ncbi:ring-opening amidohydrolase (plasmid) [Rhizobium sp. NIBRBAC000502774]|nr:ring-opening amidohydrolase [Rhizobium sp. NIBRBAC000502774]
MEARITSVLANAPNDVSGLRDAIEKGDISPAHIVAILGKTEGNGCVNDFTRGYATDTLKAFLAARTGCGPNEIERDVVFVMSGGTEGGLSPHWLVFEVRPDADSPKEGRKALAIGTAITRPFAPHEIGRMEQVRETATAVRDAMVRARIESADDVHYVQVKCPLLTKSRIAASAKNGWDVATGSTLDSMGFSRGASALGVAVALGEIPEAAIRDDVICRDYSLYSSRASTSAGVELLENQILVVGNSRHWSGELVASHDVMADAIDASALLRALGAAGIGSSYPLEPVERARIHAVLAKAEASRSGLIREARHTMLDDSDIPSSRHARALVGGVLAGALGWTNIFVSGGAEHQGPDGGGPVAVIVRRDA